MATPTHHAKRDQSQPISLIGRDEMNLAEFPIAMLADRVSKSQKTIYFEDQHGRLTVTGSDAYGLPTATDTDVIVALIYLTKIRNEFKDNRVNFSRYELINLLNWGDESWYYKRLQESLHRWNGVLLVYDKCWWNNKLKIYTDASMHIIEDVEIIDNDARRKAHASGQNGLPFSYFTWNRKFIESCQADNLRQLNLDVYFSLKSAVSKRLYRFLGKRFYVQGDWTFDLNEIAFDRVGLSRNYADAYKIKEKLQPAIAELETIGFLRPLSRDDRYSRIDRGQWTIKLTRQSPTLVAVPQAQLEPPALVTALTSRGMTKATAAELVQEQPADLIERQIEFFDWQMKKKPEKIGEPGGYLVDAIKKDYAAPKGFVSPAERQRREEARQAKERQATEERRRKQQEEAREQAERQAIAAYWESLTAEQQAELDEAAMSQAAPDERHGPMARFFKSSYRNRYIRAMQQAEGKLPAGEE